MQNNILSTPVGNRQSLQNPIMQGYTTPLQMNQGYITQNQGYITQNQFIQPLQDPVILDPIPLVDQSYISGIAPNQSGNVKDCSYYPDLKKVEFGRIKCLEVLSFKQAELEKTLGGKRTFGSVGNLNVLYFPDYDRFVLSVDSWKYVLLRRIPIVSTEPTLGGPVSYTLPTYNGFYTLTITKVTHAEALKNFETILKDNSKYSVNYESTALRQEIISNTYGASGSTFLQNQAMNATGLAPTSNIVQGSTLMPNTGYTQNAGLVSNTGLISGAGMTSTFPVNQGFTGEQVLIPGQTSFLNQSGLPGQGIYAGSGLVLGPEQTILSQSGQTQAVPLKGGQRIKRGFKRFAFKITRGFVTPNEQNLNLYQPRDLYSLKKTSEVMVPMELYPRKEVERWISYNKEIANTYGYEPENYADPNTVPLGQNSPLGASSYGRMRGYGSVDLGQGSLSNPLSLDAITSERKPTSYLTGHSTVGPSGRKNHAGYVVPSSIDKFRTHIGGHHHYHGEKTGEQTHIHQSLNGPREMTITQGTVVATTLANSHVQNTVVQETERSTVVQRLEDKFGNEEVIEQATIINQPIVQQEVQTRSYPVQETTISQPFVQQEVQTQLYPVQEVFTQETTINQPIVQQEVQAQSYPVQEVITQETTINQPIVQQEVQTRSYPVQEIVTQETYIQENPAVIQRIGTGIMSESAGTQNLTATFGNQGVMTENVIVEAPVQEGVVQTIQTTPSILQRVETRIAGLENPPVQYMQQALPQTLPTNTIGSGVVLNRDVQNPSFMDKMKGIFRSRKPADEGRIPPEQLAKLRGDGTLHHYQA